jgi:hypothetical protein
MHRSISLVLLDLLLCVNSAAYSQVVISNTPPPNTYAPPNPATRSTDECSPEFLNQGRPFSIIESSVGKPRGIPKAITEIRDSRGITLGDANTLGLPTNPDGPVGYDSCYATISYRDGSTESGILSLTQPDPNQPWVVRWFTRQDILEAKSAEDERQFQLRQQVTHQQQVDFLTRRYQMTCTLMHAIGTHARDDLSRGVRLDVVTANMITLFGSGPSAEYFGGPASAANQITGFIAKVNADMQSPPARSGLDLTSPAFLKSCQADAVRLANENAPSSP